MADLALDPRRPRRTIAGAGRLAAPALLIAAILALWQAATLLWRMPLYILPSPLQIVSAAIEARTLLGQHAWQTAQETLWGFGLALAVGLGLGFAIDASATLRSAVYPLLVISQTIPTVAIAPLLVIWLGYGIWPKIIVVGLVCFFPIVVNTADGLRVADPELIALLRTMGASGRDILTKVRLPGALPMIFAGVKIAITYSVVGAILGEWVGASQGLGVFMIRASNSFRTDWVFASIGVTALLSLALFGLVALIERLSLRWYYAAREERWDELQKRGEG
jgi:ABC-type nitrate/sulfonate/bicarbonate transport system permease component